jgi:hypothetical protein
MALIAMKSFGGMRPIANPLLLNGSDAQLAQNVRLISGAIAALRGTTTLKSTTTLAPQTIYRYGTGATEANYWLEFAGDVDVVRSPIAQDQWDRLYWTDGVTAKYAPNSLILSGASYPGGSYTLGVPKPSAAPSITASTLVPTYTKVSRQYVLTYYNPTTSKESSASAPITVQAVDSFKVTLTLPTSNNGDSGITKKRLYRQVSGTYRRVAEINLDVAKYEDSATDASLAAATALPSGVEARPSAPTSAPSASAPTVTPTSAGISRQYVYTVKNVSINIGSETEYFTESVGSNAVTVTADTTQTVTISGLASTGVTVVGAATFRVYRKDATDTLFRFVGETTGATFTDVIANSPNPTSLPAYEPDAPSTVKPSSNPTASASTSTATSVVKRIYAVTFADASGNESSLSPASNVIDAINGQTTVTVRHTESTPTGATKRRLYRQTVTFTNGAMVSSDANYKLVTEVAANTTSFSDNVADASLGATVSNTLQGLPSAPTGSGSANAEIPATVVPESRTYVYTFVSAYDEEGPPSDASTVVALDPSKSVTVLLPSGAPAGSYNLTKKRLYRSSTVGNQAQFQFVKEVSIATSSTTDEIAQADLGEVLPSEDWTPPPAGLKGLRMMANGVAVGFVGNTVWMSEPYLPHAWPHSYPIDADIVGIATFGQTVVVATKSFPYMLQGVDPAAMSTQKLELRQACVSKRSIVETGEGVLFASPDGIVSIGAGGVQLITQNVLSRDQWQAYKPDSMHAYLHNGRWHGFYNTGSQRGLLIFDFTGQGAYMTVSNLGAVGAQEVVSGFQDASTDTLYLVQGGNIVRFDAGSPLPYLWRSKIFRSPQHVNFSAAQVRASAYPVQLKVYADGALKLTKSVASEAHFRLPAGFKALDWYVEIEGTSDVTEFFMATSVAELMQV